MADKAVSIVEKRLLDVKLSELGSWLGGRDFTPNGVISAMARGRDRYYNKYIFVRKGGIGGIAMMITGYIVISYVWSFDHIKHDRWRKYH
ncbi:ATP synthase F(0) complex subunit f, mitochondrial [Gouania willdenowi]|uniref:ATP synthase subunit f, mitochondrial-like n=1 Tax=Gouania willdenowi TaxID=441366 RepID=A0A8C5G4V2_GOUWI|nr:ATP synthase subunit f, mitochondrial-like [Gouania willdenowi]